MLTEDDPGVKWPCGWQRYRSVVSTPTHHLAGGTGTTLRFQDLGFDFGSWLSACPLAEENSRRTKRTTLQGRHNARAAWPARFERSLTTPRQRPHTLNLPARSGSASCRAPSGPRTAKQATDDVGVLHGSMVVATEKQLRMVARP
jgi:hypothetical protein